MKVASTSRSTTQRSFDKLSSSLNLSLCSIAKATPSVPRPHLHAHLPQVPLINDQMLCDLPVGNSAIGNGRFGSCIRMTYKDMFIVCVKKMAKDLVSLQALKSEAAVLFALNSGDSTPHCFGVCLSLHAIIMTYINLNNNPVSLFSLLYEKHYLSLPFSTQQCKDMLVSLCKGLQYIHSSGFLHNDIKLDNIVVGNSITGKIKPYIIDFGKACHIREGRKYSLSDADINMYKREHPHIAPDLRDGLTHQSELTDMYSFGRVLKRCNSVILHSSKLSQSVLQVLSYYSKDRPDVETILTMLINK